MSRLKCLPILPAIKGVMGIEDIFWSRVDQSHPDRCWHWQGTLNSNGYGIIKVNGRGILAHRFAQTLATAKDEPDLMVLHSCDNPPCCNPQHLRWGTSLENLRDAQKRGRVHKWSGQRSGQGNPSAKLTLADVSKIRASFALGIESYGDLAKKFGVCQSSIRNIINGRTWVMTHTPETRNA